MVTATDNPKVWRIEIPTLHSTRSKSEIVCYLMISELGLRVYYSHHFMYDRAVDSGPWSNPSISWHMVNPQLCAQIESSIAEAIWEIARGDKALEILPLPPELMHRPTLTLKDVEL